MWTVCLLRLSYHLRLGTRRHPPRCSYPSYNSACNSPASVSRNDYVLHVDMVATLRKLKARTCNVRFGGDPGVSSRSLHGVNEVAFHTLCAVTYLTRTSLHTTTTLLFVRFLGKTCILILICPECLVSPRRPRWTYPVQSKRVREGLHDFRLQRTLPATLPPWTLMSAR